MTESIQIDINGNPADFIADAKKVQEQMDVLKYRLEKAGVSQAAYNKAVANSKNVMQEQVRQTKSMTMSWTDFRSMYSTVLDAVRVGQAIWAETGQKFVEYAESVKNMSRTLGASAEETSRLIQVADDVRVSYDTMKIAMKEAQKDGIQPNIDGLAKLSDKYLALAPGVQRTKFLLDTFGKSGMEMGKLMEMGGKGIREASEAISENLIMTDKGIKASDDYQASLDNLKDSMDGLAMSAGEKFTPVMADVWKIITANIEAFTTFGDVLEGKVKINDWAAAIINANNVQEDAVSTTKKAIDATGDYTEELFDNKEALKKAEDALKDYKSQLDAISDANKDALSFMRNYADFQGNYEDDHKDALSDIAEAEEDLRQAREKASDTEIKSNRKITDAQSALSSAVQKYGANSEQAAKARLRLSRAMEDFKDGDQGIADATKKLEEAKAGVQELEASWHESTQKMVYDMTLAKVSINGLTDSEFAAMQDLAVEKGLITKEEAEASKRMMEEAAALAIGISQQENVMTEENKNNKVLSELEKQIEIQKTAETQVEAAGVEKQAIAQVTLMTDGEINAQLRLRDAALRTAAAYRSIPMSGFAVQGVTVSKKKTDTGGERDSGGPGIAGTPYVINPVAAPEVFIPSSNGTFVPNADKKGLLGGGATYNIVVNNPKKETAENSIRKALKAGSYTGRFQ